MLHILTVEDLKLITPEITELYITNNFNEPLDNLPTHLTKIVFDTSYEYEHKLEFLPESLEYLSCNHMCTLEEIRNFPNSLKKLKLSMNTDYDTDKNILPPNVLPPNLICLTLSNSKLVKGSLPLTLKHLNLTPSYFYKIEKGVLHEGLTHLYFVDSPFVNITGILPSTLTHLSLEHYDEDIVEPLPPNLVELSLGVDYTSEIKEEFLPQTLKKLKISDEYEYSFPEDIEVKYLVDFSGPWGLDECCS